MLYRQFLTVVFVKEEIDAATHPNEEVHAAVGLVQGFPCYLSLIRERGKEGKFSLALGSEFLSSLCSDGSDPDWEDDEREKWRGLRFKVLRGSIGHTPLDDTL